MVKLNSVCIIGLGYIGLPTASTFATHGLQVYGVDSNPDVINTLSHGRVHIFEPGLQEVVDRAVKSGNLQVY
ncbi:MAG TPA: UDP-N-acetyl-D-mannosamine dehydrogenase, partial [Anaerolineaceae bacterium]|nr:UDP-N-acetyl-D-mannosamine dehydrogenase [Anaerolineaceae bacterium]